MTGGAVPSLYKSSLLDSFFSEGSRTPGQQFTVRAKEEMKGRRFEV